LRQAKSDTRRGAAAQLLGLSAVSERLNRGKNASSAIFAAWLIFETIVTYLRLRAPPLGSALVVARGPERL